MPANHLHRVLIIDDEPAVRWTIAIPFQRRGVDTDVAESGKEAIRLLSRDKCDYCSVLLDLNIPPPDGVEIARFIRDNCSGIPVIVISGYPDLAARIKNEDLDACGEVGITADDDHRDAAAVVANEAGDLHSVRRRNV